MDYEVCPALYRELEAINPDVVVTTDATYYISHVSAMFCRRRRIPYVLWSEQWANNFHPRHIVMKPIERMTIKHAASAIAFSSKATEYLLKYGIARDRVITAYNTCPSVPLIGCDDRKVVRKELGYPPERPLVLYFGRVERIKGISTLLRAAAICSSEGLPHGFVIAGTGGYLERAKAIASKLGLSNVRFTGRWVDARQKALLLGAADVVVLPSQRWWAVESWGLVLNEALSVGRYVIASDEVGAAYDLIRDPIDGLIFKAGDPVSLAKAIAKTGVSDPSSDALRRQRYHQQFNLNQMVETIVKAVRLAIESRKGHES